jgi:hypothetical protein
VSTDGLAFVMRWACILEFAAVRADVTSSSMLGNCTLHTLHIWVECTQVVGILAVVLVVVVVADFCVMSVSKLSVILSL